MSKLAVLDKTYDLFLGYSWGFGSQGISGHLYECIEYYYILKKHMKVGIFVCTSESLSIDSIKTAIEDKYDFTTEEINELISNIHYFDSPKVLSGNNLLLVDGNFSKLKDIHLLFKNIMAFACHDRAFTNMNNVTVFLDSRIYSCSNHTHYIKKILFSRYKKIGIGQAGVNLVYNKTGPRFLGNDIYTELEQTYQGNFLVVTNSTVGNISNRFNIVSPPIQDLFEKFDTYIYTPIPKKFDCSPRFIAECKWYDRKVIYHNVDYWDVDKGLYWRKQDIENNFDSIFLKEDDQIINLVKGVINV